MKKYLISLIVILSIILAGLIVVFVLVLNGTVTKQTLGIDVSKSSAVNSGIDDSESAVYNPSETDPASVSRKIVVLDPGHGKSSGAMSGEEKKAEGWIYNSVKGSWGEWRHWKSGTMQQDCEGSGCSRRAPSGGGCWYPIANGDRDIEPDINLSNAEYAKMYLEKMGYTVRMTRENADQNPSMTKRLTYCYESRNTDLQPDADVFVCIHSNAGGGRGSAYMSLSGLYDQAGVFKAEDYIAKSNALGRCINNRIVTETNMPEFSGGNYSGLPEAILFCKSPVPIAYLEIGFFDNASDLSILLNESEAIGRAIANGIDEYFNSENL